MGLDEEGNVMRWDQLLHVRVDGELAATLRRLADENRSTVSQIVRRALAEHAARELYVRATTDLVPGGAVSRAVGGVLAGQEGRVFGAGRGLIVKPRLDDVRLLHQMPGDDLNIHDLDDATRVLDDYLRNANLDREVRQSLVSDMLRVREGNWEEVVDVRDRAQIAVAGKLAEKEVPENLRLQLTKSVKEFETDVRVYGTDEAGDDLMFPGAKTVVIGGEEKALASAGLLVEYTDRTIPLTSLDDVREIRRLTGMTSGIYQSLPGKLLYGVHDYLLAPLTSAVWKPLVLLRLALPVRVLMEEQARMTTAGLDTLLNHPASYIAWLLGRKGEDSVEDFAAAMSRRGAGYTGEAARQTSYAGMFREGVKEIWESGGGAGCSRTASGFTSPSPTETPTWTHGRGS